MWEGDDENLLEGKAKTPKDRLLKWIQSKVMWFCVYWIFIVTFVLLVVWIIHSIDQICEQI